MSEDISKMLSGLLANPEGIKNLMNSISRRSETSVAPSEAELTNPFANLSHVEDKRITLLNALKPYLGSTRSANVDKAIQLLRLTKLAENFRNEGK